MLRKAPIRTEQEHPRTDEREPRKQNAPIDRERDVACGGKWRVRKQEAPIHTARELHALANKCPKQKSPVRTERDLHAQANRSPKNKKAADKSQRASLITSLTITYFHTGCSTIIGAKSFHGPVRDGKGWYRLAMVIRHNLYECRTKASL